MYSAESHAYSEAGTISRIPFINSGIAAGGATGKTEMNIGRKLNKYLIAALIAISPLRPQVHNISPESSDLSSADFFSVGITDTTTSYYPTPLWFEAPLVFEDSNLPIIVLNTDGRTIEDESRIIARMGVINNGAGERNSVTDPFNEYDGRISIELRGTSTLRFLKKSYALETQDSLGENNNVSLLGMPPENDWILYAPYADKSLLRNVLAFKLGRDLGYYEPRTRFCELVLNGDYRGVYVLMEKIKIDANRLDLARLQPTDIEGDELTGGYVIKIDWEDWGGWESYGKKFYYHHPQEDRLEQEQKFYIEEYIRTFEEVLRGPGFMDRQDGYARYLDIGAFIDFALIQELAKNVDGFRISTFMYKEKDSQGGKLTMGPLWDFNIAFGNMYEGVFWDSTGWSRGHELDPTVFWWDRLMGDSTFVNQLVIRWYELRAGVFQTDTIMAYIDSVAAHLDEAQQRNFDRWNILGTYVWPNAVVWDTYEEEVSYLKRWLTARLTWIDNNIMYSGEGGAAAGDVGPIAYPNPSFEDVKLYYRLLMSGRITITVYNLLGQEVVQLVDEQQSADRHYSIWNGRDKRGIPVASGIYFCTLQFNGMVLYVYKITRYRVGS